MKALLLASLLLYGAAFAASPSSINNDDSCDIKVGPAATLLLPYFEVDVTGTSGRTTLFTITNVTRYPQIAHVTLWTDWAYENTTAFSCSLAGPACTYHPTTPSSGVISSSASDLYPALSGNDVGGWFYLNLNNFGSDAYSVTRNVAGLPVTTTNGQTNLGYPRASQNWVTVTMFGSLVTNRMTAEFDAASLGNGCSPAGFSSDAVPIGPARGRFVCPPGTTLTNGTTALCTGTNANPIP